VAARPHPNGRGRPRRGAAGAWPTRQQLVTYTIVVLVFVAAMMAITSLLDLGFGWVMFEIFA
jgi:preprotein translocase SecE subunit